MATNILMPALSPTMTEGTLARWLKKEGEQVRAGDVIAEIETDKATMEVEAVDEGVLGKILVPDGTANVKVNAPIATLLEDGEPTATPPAKNHPLPRAGEGRGEGGPPAQTPMPSPIETAPVETTSGGPAAVHANGHDKSDRIAASPLARRMAYQANIDLTALKGTGPNGRIVRADIQAAQNKLQPAVAASPAAPMQVQAPLSETPQPTPAPAPNPAAPITAPHRLVPNTAMRKIISRRLLESHQTVPFFFVTLDLEIDALLKLRAELNAKAPKDGAGTYKLSVNDFVIKACAATLRRVPELNASYTDDNMILYVDIDIAVAVSLPTGLITPIVRQADRKGLATISSEIKDLGARAKSGKLKPEEFQGGTFSISNMGMFGTKQFTAIINPPQAAILAVGAGEPRPVVKDGALAIATVMTCTLSVDHRVADGALGAQWMAEFKRIVEDPLSLML